MKGKMPFLCILHGLVLFTALYFEIITRIHFVRSGRILTKIMHDTINSVPSKVLEIVDMNSS